MPVTADKALVPSTAKAAAPQQQRSDSGMDSGLQPPDLLSTFKLQQAADQSQGVQNLNALQGQVDQSERVEIIDVPVEDLLELFRKQGKAPLGELPDSLLEQAKTDPRTLQEIIEIFDIPIPEEIEIIDIPEEMLEAAKKDKSIFQRLKEKGSEIGHWLTGKSNLIKDKQGEGAYSRLGMAGHAASAAMGGVDVYSDYTEIKEQSETVNDASELEPETVQANLRDLKSNFSGLLQLDINQMSEINIVEEYFVVVEALDMFKITNALSALGSYKIAKKEKKKINILEQQKKKAASVPGFPEELAEVAAWGVKKVTRSYYTAMANAVLDAVQFISRMVTLVSGAMAAPFTEAINLIALVAQKGIKAYHLMKGMFKFLSGTKGINRKQNAEVIFNLVASGNPHAVEFLTAYYSTQIGKTQKRIYNYIIEPVLNKIDPKLAAQLKQTAQSAIVEMIRDVKANEAKTEYAAMKTMIIMDLADMFKSKPPAGMGAIFDLVLQDEAFQKGLGSLYSEGVNHVMEM